MSREDENGGIFHMYKPSMESKILVPETALSHEFEKLRFEKEQEEAAKMLFDLEKQKQEEINSKLEKLEMLPLGNKIVISPYPRNPYRKVLEGSIIVDYDGSFKNPDSGEQDKHKEFVSCARVIEVGPDCNFLKAGDDVYYMPNTAYPLPFMTLGYLVTTEPQTLCVVGEGLKERKTNKK